MATDYSARYSKTLGCGVDAMGGAASGLGIEALAGDTEMVTVFDDFNGHIAQDSFSGATILEDSGWVLTDVGVPVADVIHMNSAATVVRDFDSCLHIFPGTDDDAGGNMQLDVINGAIGTLVTNHPFPHIWVPETATIPSGGLLSGVSTDAGEGLDNTSWMFATRIGFRSDDTAQAGAGVWNSKCFIGWARAGDTSIMTATTGALSVAGATDFLIGFHVPEDGSIDGISQGRLGTTAYVEGTNFTELVAAGGVNNTVANSCSVVYQTVWYDLALRMDITNMSDDAANGTTTFYYRRVQPGVALPPWTVHTTQLDNATANSSVALVPTIEAINGPTAGRDGSILIDWWAFGRNRVNR
jgi:hypothetical protein